MKELQTHEKDKVEIVDESRIKKELTLIGKQRRVPGLTLWQYNTLTKELTEASFRKSDHVVADFSAEASRQVSTSHQVEVNEHCLYFQALNRKSAVNHLKKKVDPNIIIK